MRPSIRAAGTVLAAVTLALAGAVLPSPAAAQEAPPPSGADVVAACDPLRAAPELGPRACRSVQGGVWVPAGACRWVTAPEDEAPEEDPCAPIDGRRVSEAAMGEFEAGWTHRALTLQDDLDRHVPLVEALLPHTHNSANSTAYAPSLTTIDPNQIVTVTDQLRLGMRAIELDVHWAPHPEGPSEDGYRRVVQCHGQSQGGVHVGCSADQPLEDRLAELRTWLEGNPDEVVLLYLENVLDDDPVAHERAVELLDRELGDVVLRPTPPADGGCADLPVTTLSEHAVRTAGKNVVLVGNCGPSGWSTWVFQRGDGWAESQVTDFTGCDPDRRPEAGHALIRHWEDSTWLSSGAGTGSRMDADLLAELVRCGVNLPGLDQVHPDDARLDSFVWSWRAQEPAVGATGRCAAQGPDSRFGAEDCSRALPVACRSDAGWAVTQAAVPWAGADAACAAEGLGVAGTPVNGWDNTLLRRAAGGGEGPAVWLAYAQEADGSWVLGGPGITPDAEPEPDPEPDRPGKGKGHGGKPAEPGRPAGTGGPASIATTPASTSSPAGPGRSPALLLVALTTVALAGSRRRALHRRNATAGEAG